MRKVLYMFGVLTDGDVDWMARTASRRSLRDGEVLIAEGSRPDALIVVLDGSLAVSREGHGEIARLGAGDIVGEISLVDSAPASATVTALGAGIVLVIDRRVLQRQLDADAGFAARFYRAVAIFLADRLRAVRQPVPPALLGASLLGREGLSGDELDPIILDTVSAAGERFNAMLRLLGPRA